MNQLQSKINIRSDEFKNNQAAMHSLVAALRDTVQQTAISKHEKPQQKHVDSDK